MLTSSRLNRHRQPVQLFDIVSGVLSGLAQLLRPLLLISSGSLLIVIIIIIISGVNSLTLLPFKPPLLLQARPPPLTVERSSTGLPANNINNNNSNNQHLAATKTHKPPQRAHKQSSSSSTQLEDLNDSSIRTRLGALNGSWSERLQLLQQHQQQYGPKAAADFEELIDRLLRPLSSAAQKSVTFGQQPPEAGADGKQLRVAADPNNKTTMRFFRNNKTFASIVYTNEQLVPPSSSATVARKPRKLINCHLVDLEKHSADVEVFEAKYQIKTIDVEFREMMQLIDACTDIARSLRSSTDGVSQLFAAALPKLTPGSSGAAAAGPVTQQQQQQQQQMLRKLMDGSSHTHTNKEFKSLAPRAATSANKLQLLQAATPPGALLSYIRRPFLGEAPELVNRALSRVGETGKRLFLGEVTPLPGLVEARGGSIKEALQEITSYDTTDLLAIWRGILPGTNWCGMGDRATSYNDLGFELDIDICCRAHDFCPIRLSALSAGYGLFNWSFYTRSHCWCDQNFLDCLQRAQSPLSSVVMKFYFTIMKTTCLHDNETIAADPFSNSAAAAAAAATKQKLSPMAVAWARPLGGLAKAQKLPADGSNNNNNNNNNDDKQKRQEQSATEREHQLLLEQIRDKWPIPAQKLSQAFYSNLDHKAPLLLAGKKKIASTKPLEAGYK